MSLKGLYWQYCTSTCTHGVPLFWHANYHLLRWYQLVFANSANNDKGCVILLSWPVTRTLSTQLVIPSMEFRLGKWNTDLNQIYLFGHIPKQPKKMFKHCHFTFLLLTFTNFDLEFISQVMCPPRCRHFHQLWCNKLLLKVWQVHVWVLWVKRGYTDLHINYIPKGTCPLTVSKHNKWSSLAGLTLPTSACFSANTCCINCTPAMAAAGFCLLTHFFQFANRQDRCFKLILHPVRVIYIAYHGWWVICHLPERFFFF